MRSPVVWIVAVSTTLAIIAFSWRSASYRSLMDELRPLEEKFSRIAKTHPHRVLCNGGIDYGEQNPLSSVVKQRNQILRAHGYYLLGGWVVTSNCRGEILVRVDRKYIHDPGYWRTKSSACSKE